MKARKLGALLLGAVLTVASLTGCSASGQTTSGAEAQATAENGYGLEEFVMVMIPGEDTEKSIQLRDTMAEKMSEAIGVPVTTYRATDYSAAVEAMRTGNAQLAYLGPFSYVTARERAGAECLVVQGEVGTKGGYFGDEEGKEPERFVEISDSDYDYLADLKETYNLSD